jgi:hypothetical protein
MQTVKIDGVCACKKKQFAARSLSPQTLSSNELVITRSQLEAERLVHKDEPRLKCLELGMPPFLSTSVVKDAAWQCAEVSAR